ncbi:MAG: FAD-dependent oxidoreductase [Phycisphaerae bacterium]|nr:FAD-dependent oxidoreductase [Phycisphaerae bacterium]
MPTETVFDILVLGAGPAGAAAAAFAAKKGLNVAVLDRSASLGATGGSSARAVSPVGARGVHTGRQAAGSTCRPEWLHPDAHKMLASAGVASDGAVLGTIDRVRFVDGARGRTASAPLGVAIDVVDTPRLTEAMCAAATSAGAAFIPGAKVVTIETREQAVILSTDTDQRFTGRFLLAADGCDSLAIQSFGLDRGQAATTQVSCCQSVSVRADPTAKKRNKGNTEMSWILTSQDLSSFGYLFTTGSLVVTGLVAPTPTDGIRAVFEQAVAQWKDAEILPEDVNVDPANIEVRPVPRGIALEMETHVAKHSLIIGDAGGYVAAVSHEGLYPCIWSASLATEVCEKALGAVHPQDILAEFDARWRRDMVKYLRLPSTDLRFLTPLVFTNERMAQRLANWFLGGTGGTDA